MCIVVLFCFLSQQDINIQEGKYKVKCKPLTSKEAIQHLPPFIWLISDEKNILFIFIMQNTPLQNQSRNLLGLGIVKGGS